MAYNPDLEVGGEAAEDGTLRRRGFLLRLGRHRRRRAAMRPGCGWLGFLPFWWGGKRSGGEAAMRLRLE